jgi:plasmid stabilization system protein ParE
MGFRVEISHEAQADLTEIYDYIRRHGPADPDRWLSGLNQKFESLEDFADWASLAPEDESAKEEIRQVMYGPFRILFVITDNDVDVVTVRHGARRFLTAAQIDYLTDKAARQRKERSEESNEN